MRRHPQRQTPSRRGNVPGWTLVFLALVASIDSGCGAYYNTFYHARKSYEEAERQQRASGLEHPSPQVLSLYQQAADKSQKVIDQWPDSKWVDDARYLMGLAYLGREQYEEARAAFQKLIARHPDSKLVASAQLGIGRAHLGLKDYTRADQELGGIIERYPNFEARDEVVLYLARSAAEQRDDRSAIAQYGQLLSRKLDKDIELEALRGRGAAYLAVGVYDSALADFDAAHSLAKEPQIRYDIDLERGQCLEQLARFDAALNLYERVEREMPDANHAPRTQIQKGRVLTTMERYEDALEIYRHIIERYPASSYAGQAQFQIGATYELYLDDYAKAIDAYSLVRQQGRSEFIELADQRLDDLRQFGELRQQAGEGADESQAEAAYQLAELKLFRFKQPEEALTAFETVESDYPETSYAPKASYAAAYILEHEMGDSTAALAVHQRLYERYPNTEYGIHAGARIGAVDPDSLTILLGRITMRRARADSLVRVAELLRADSLAATVPAADSVAAAADSVAAAADSVAADSMAAPSDSAVAVSDTAGVAAALQARLAGQRHMRDSLLAERRARRDSLDRVLRGEEP